MAHPEPLLVQAPVKALDENGVNVAAIGTMAFVISTIALVISTEWLQQTGNQWWLWVAVAGSVIGVLFLTFCLIRKARRKS